MGWGRSNWSKKIKLNVWNSMNGMERNEYRTMTCKHILAPISARDQFPVYVLASRADQEHLYSVAMYWIHIHLYDCTSITYYIYIYVYLHILDLTYQYIYIHIYTYRFALSLKPPYSKELPSQKETHIQSSTHLCSRKGMHRWCCLFQNSQEKAAWTTNIKIGWAYWCQEVIFMLLSNA